MLLILLILLMMILDCYYTPRPAGKAIIQNSLSRVAKKKYADQPEQGTKFVNDVMSRISTSTSRFPHGESGCRSH